ncbi:MAG: hypothetical protein FWG68_03010, partial [Defluviitaleaceae bacterium]|nr:hypothetical protein [Defluviitaleaceae bacterium]
MKHMKKLIFIAILTTLFLGIRYSTVSLNAAEISAGVSQDFTVNVPQSGQFNLIFEYLPQSTFLNPEFSLQINGEFQTFPLFQNFSQTPTIANPPNSTTQRLLVPILWEYQTFEFLRNRAGHELLPQPSIIDGWHTAFIYDADFLDISPIIVNLNSGDNVLTITGLSGDFAVREIRAAAPQA